MTSPFVLITGATGNQGSAVVKHLLAKGIKGRALTRNGDNPAAKKVRHAGVEIAFGEMNDRASLDRAANSGRSRITPLTRFKRSFSTE